MDGLNEINSDSLKAIFKSQPRLNVTKLNKAKNEGVLLKQGRSTRIQSRKMLTARLDRRTKAVEQIGRLPCDGEELHCIVSCEFSLFEFIVAAIELSKQPIDHLTIATLGFSKQNIASLGELIDAGQVKRLTIICANYFKSMDKEVYAQAVELCRKHGFKLAARRTHAKVLLMAIGDARFVVSGSANLRACHSVEQMTMWRSAELYEFHREWIAELMLTGSDK